MDQFEGTILVGRSFDPVRGRVVVEGGQIAAVERTETDSSDIVLPGFVNAHTHVGDAVAPEQAVGLGLEAAVAPPESLKHRRLNAATPAELRDAMHRALRFMERTGTAAFLDFRENGREGARLLRQASQRREIAEFIFGSGDASVFDFADGYGASGANDDDYSPQRAAARAADVPFAVHAGEPDPTDIHPALDLEPDLLVHMVHAEAEHLRRVADQAVPVVVCPRANLVLGVGSPPVRDLLDHTTVALGTDNVMLNPPSMFRELAYTAKTYDVDADEALRMATVAGAEAVGLNCGLIEPGRRAALLVLDGESDNLAATEDPVRAVVRRAGPLDVKSVVV